MKLPSLTPLPQYQKFAIKTRYYDPAKEEMEDRISRIRHELAAEQNSDDTEARKRLFSTAFQRRVKASRSANTLQIFIMVFLIAGIVGYLYLGNDVLYLLSALVIPTYLYYRFKGKGNA